MRKGLCFLVLLMVLTSSPLAPARAAASLELYGTFHAMGVIVTIDASDDSDEDATASVEYRVSGSNDAEAVIEEEQTRSINRKSINKRELLRAILDPSTTTYQVVYQLAIMILKRTKEKVFTPNAPQKVLNVSDYIFAVIRTSIDGEEQILAMINVTAQTQKFEFNRSRSDLKFEEWVNILGNQKYTVTDDSLKGEIEPYGVYWLKGKK